MSLIIRPATTDDIPAIAAIHVAGWHGAYGGIIDQDFIDSQTLEKRTVDWAGWFAEENNHYLIAELDGEAVGFAAYGNLRTPPPGTSKIRPLYSAEIYGLYLLPDVWRQGVGTALMKAAAADLKEKKHTSLCLWVLDKNKRACYFYQKMGGQRVGKKMREFGASNHKEVCYGWRDVDIVGE